MLYSECDLFSERYVMLAHGSSAVSIVPCVIATIPFYGVTVKQQLALRLPLILVL